MINHIKKSILFMVLSMTFLACNKDDLDIERTMHIVVNGYNGSSNALQIAIDTTQFDKSVSNGKYITSPAALMGFSIAYTYYSQNQRFFTLTDTITKKIVFSKMLPATGTKAVINFVYLDGKELEINPPAADANTNKLGFYVQYKGSEVPFDIFLYRKDNATGQEYRHYLAKNAKSGTWIYFDYTPSSDFNTKNVLGNSSICFTKAGTTDQWAFENDERMSTLSVSGMSFPLAGEKGLVQPYFVIPGPWQLNQSRMFFYPDRPW